MILRQDIYIMLIGEGVNVSRPTLGQPVGENVYEVLPTDDYDPGDERWELTERNHISKNIQDIQNFSELAEFVNELRSHLHASPEEWESHTIDDYLEAMSAWIRDHYAYCKAANEELPSKEAL